MLKNAKIIVFSTVFLSFLLVFKPATAQTIQQLDQLSIEELRILFEHQLNQAEIVIQSCYQGAASYPIMQSTCKIQEMQYQNHFNQLRLYINRRRILEK